MNHEQISENPNQIDFGNTTVEHKQNAYGINVDGYIFRYGVEHPQVIETLHNYSTLSFLLGRVTVESEGTDFRPDGVERNYYLLKEGSGMFGLTNPEDADRWKGIFNHIMGNARHSYWLSNRLKNISPEQREQLEERGFDFSEFDTITPELLRDFIFISHSGRRAMDEYNWHGIRDNAHTHPDSGVATIVYLSKEYADPKFLNLMRTEIHADIQADVEKGIFTNVVDNIYSWSDWTFNQKPVRLQERFVGLQKSQRASADVLNTLEKAGFAFEQALIDIVDSEIFEHMVSAPIPKWEMEIRNAYAASSGSNVNELFPDY